MACKSDWEVSQHAFSCDFQHPPFIARLKVMLEWSHNAFFFFPSHSPVKFLLKLKIKRENLLSIPPFPMVSVRETALLIPGYHTESVRVQWVVTSQESDPPLLELAKLYLMVTTIQHVLLCAGWLDLACNYSRVLVSTQAVSPQRLQISLTHISQTDSKVYLAEGRRADSLKCHAINRTVLWRKQLWLRRLSCLLPSNFETLNTALPYQAHRSTEGTGKMHRGHLMLKSALEASAKCRACGELQCFCHLVYVSDQDNIMRNDTHHHILMITAGVK